MGFLEDLFAFFKEYYQDDEITDFVNKRDYFNLVNFCGVYPIMTKKTVHWIILQWLFTLMISIFFLAQSIKGTLILAAYNLNMASFIFQYGTIVGFVVVILVMGNLKRPSYRIIHSEMIYKTFQYEMDDQDFIDRVFREMKKEKIQLLVLPLVVAMAGLNSLVIGPFIDSKYGTSLAFNVSDVPLNWDLPIAIPFPLSSDWTLTWYIGVFVECAVTYILATTMFTCGVVFINITQYISFHLMYLQHNIQNLEKRAQVLYSRLYAVVIKIEDNRIYEDMMYMMCFEDCLKRSIQHHQKILR